MAQPTRGVRNNNPLNIRHNPRNRWQGLSANQTDHAFCHFDSMVYGVRAAMKLLRNYAIQLHHCTINDYITRWAPPSENNTQNYIDFICKQIDYPSNINLYFRDRPRFIAMVRAMGIMESNYIIPDEILNDAYDMV